MKKISQLAICTALMAIVPGFLSAQDVAPEENEKIIREGFRKWTAGEGSFFDLLHDQVSWTITGSTPLSKTYTSKEQFLNAVIIPLNKRLEKKIVPDLKELYAKGNAVVALWEGKATAKDGRPYNMMYSWYMYMERGKIVRVIAFLDGNAFTDIMTRAID